MTVGAKGRHLMIELPQDVFPAELKDVLFQIQLKGVTPLISHPERHAAIQHGPALLADLIHAGSLTQVTAGSLDGSFGPRIQDCALKLLRQNMVHVVASDAHNCDWRAPRLSTARQIVQHARGEREAALLFLERPAQILEGAYIESPEPETERERPKKRGLLSRLFSS